MVAPRRVIVAALVTLFIAVGLGPASAVIGGRAPVVSLDPAARIEPRLVEELEAAGPLGTVQVLVGGTDVEAAAAAVKTSGLPVLLRFDKVGFVATKGTPAAVRSIAAQPDVRYLQGNRPLAASMTTATTATRVVEAEQTFEAPDGTPLDGSGIGIAVVDSGMAGDHPMYQDETGKTRLLNIKQACVNLLECGTQAGDEPDEYFINATGLDTDVTATGGHGTHVTSIAGGREVTASNGVKVRGVARNASLYGLGAGAGLFTINAAASLNWVLEHHADPCGAFSVPPVDVAGGCAPIRVVNNSYGSPGEYDPADFFAVVGERLVLEGVTVVWAAGNGDDITATDPRPNDGSVNLANPPGQSPKNGILMVANYDDKESGTRDGDLNTSSSRGERGRPETYPDFAAPGTNILAACKPYLPICSSAYEDPNYGEIGGTSMAAPHVAGIVALLLQAYPDLTPEDIEDLLEDTAYRFGDPASYEPDVTTAGAPIPNQVRNDTPTSFDKGHGLVDLSAALYRLGGLADPGVTGGTNPCAVASNAFADPSGDATELVLVDTGAAQASYPGLDVVKGSATPLPDGTVRFAVGVTDLTDAPAPGATGDNFRFNFSFNSKALELGMSRSLDETGGYSTRFDLFENGLTEDVDIAMDLVGGFDAAADEIWAIVPSDAVQRIYPALPLLTYGSRLEAVQVLGQRMEGAPGGPTATPTVDTAAASCPLVLPQPPPPPPDPDPEPVKPGKGKGRDNGNGPK